MYIFKIFKSLKTQSKLVKTINKMKKCFACIGKCFFGNFGWKSLQ